MQKKFFQRCFVCAMGTLISTAFLQGCSSDSKDSATVYQSNVQVIRPITIPRDLSDTKMSDDFPLPKFKKPLPQNTPVSLIPPGSSIGKN